MMMMLNHVGSLYAPAKADELAATLNADEANEGWSYTAVHDPKGTGWSFIEIRDEEGIYVGKL